MAETNYIDRLARQLYTLMKGDELTKGLEQKKAVDRIGVFQDLLIQAIKKSTLCCFNGRPYYFNGRIYVQLGKDSWDAFNSLVLRVADKCGLPPGDKTRLEGVKKVCRGEVSLITLEPDSSIIVLNNGVLNLEDNTFHKFHKRFKQVTQMDFDYDPDEMPLLWTNFLEDVLGDAEIRVLQEFMGAIFIDRRKVKIEKMMILFGPGSNGKSVVQSTLIGLLGEENVKTLAISDLISGSERKQNIASINGKRLNYCSEIQTQEFGKNSDTLKALISGEPFEVRLVYINNFTARNIPLLMANANRIPYIHDYSHGLSRRLIILPFERIIEEKSQNKQLARQLQKEYPAILNWMLQGRNRLIANNYQFSIPQSLQDLVDEYQAESSSVLRYMKAKDYNRSLADLEVNIRWMEARKLYFAYVKWCAENSITPESEKKFGMTLREAGFSKDRKDKCVVYGVYQRNVRPVKEEFKKKNENNLIDGMDNLAHWCGVSRQTIEKMVRNNLLQGCYTKEGRRYWFMLDKCRAAIRKFLKKDKRGEEYRYVDKDLKADRRSFNKYMTERGLPFRKYDKKDPHALGIIYVTDEFNYQLDKNDWKRFVKFQTDTEFDPATAPDFDDEDLETENQE